MSEQRKAAKSMDECEPTSGPPPEDSLITIASFRVGDNDDDPTGPTEYALSGVGSNQFEWGIDPLNGNLDSGVVDITLTLNRTAGTIVFMVSQYPHELVDIHSSWSTVALIVVARSVDPESGCNLQLTDIRVTDGANNELGYCIGIGNFETIGKLDPSKRALRLDPENYVPFVINGNPPVIIVSMKARLTGPNREVLEEYGSYAILGRILAYDTFPATVAAEAPSARARPAKKKRITWMTGNWPRRGGSRLSALPPQRGPDGGATDRHDH